jgi:CTP:molybdopterin cytidylyltransferase MocA/uncharacterized damage-inducible protein DinB
VLLAAGASRRLGTPKQLLVEFDGVPRVRRAAAQLLDAGCSPVLVVTGAFADEVGAALRGLPVILVHNAAHADGMGTSIACGMHALGGMAPARAFENSTLAPAASGSLYNRPSNERETQDRKSAVLIAACDMPTADAAHLRALVARSEKGTRRVASAYVSHKTPDNGAIVLGIPAVFPALDWDMLGALAGDRGAKVLLAASETLSVSLFRGMFDLDTPADVAEWRANPPPTLSSSADATMSSIAQSGLADLDHEVANTRKMLSRVPADHLDYTPHAKSWPLGKLANHLCDFPWWGEVTLTTSELDFAQPMPPRPPQPTDAAGFLAQFDERMAKFRTALATVTDAQMMETWTMRNGDAVLMAMPKIAVLRGMVISHMIHHRAQLTLYYRMLDIPVPGLYGPSADEQ